MDTFDLSHKLAYAGRRSPIPFYTGPQFLNSVPGVPVLSELRIFINPSDWSHPNVMTICREICRVLGSTAQFDVGITLAGTPAYDASRAAAGNVARLIKLDPSDPTVTLRIRDDNGDHVWQARYPRLAFEDAGEDYWRSQYSTGAAKIPTEQ